MPAWRRNRPKTSKVVDFEAGQVISPRLLIGGDACSSTPPAGHDLLLRPFGRNFRTVPDSSSIRSTGQLNGLSSTRVWPPEARGCPQNTQLLQRTIVAVAAASSGSTRTHGADGAGGSPRASRTGSGTPGGYEIASSDGTPALASSIAACITSSRDVSGAGAEIIGDAVSVVSREFSLRRAAACHVGSGFVV